MERFGMVLAGCAVLALLGGPAGAQNEPVVKAWGNYLVVTAPDEGTSPRDLATRQQLTKQEVTFNFQDIPFPEAVEFLATASGLNFVVHRNAGVQAATVNLALKKVSAQTALTFLTQQVSLSWTVRDGIVLIGHKEDLVGPMRTGVYDVTDLLAVPPDFKGPRMEMPIGNNPNQQPRDIFNLPTQPRETEADSQAEKSRADLMQELVDIVDGMLKAGTWDESNFP